MPNYFIQTSCKLNGAALCYTLMVNLPVNLPVRYYTIFINTSILWPPLCLKEIGLNTGMASFTELKYWLLLLNRTVNLKLVNLNNEVLLIISVFKGGSDVNSTVLLSIPLSSTYPVKVQCFVIETNTVHATCVLLLYHSMVRLTIVSFLRCV